MPALDKGFGKTVEGAMATAGSKGGASLQAGMLGGLADAAGKIAAALGLFEIAKKFAEVTKMAVDAYADYEQLVGGVETLYGDAADDLIANAQRAYQTAGMSANDYMEMTTSFAASLVNSLGGDTEEAARMADMAIRDMSDNANKMGTDMAAIQNAYQGFAKQNYTMLDNLKLGYGGTRGEMERLLADAEAISGIHYDIENYADVVDAIHVIQTEMGITGTTAKEAASTISGSWASLQASWENLLVSLAGGGEDIDTAIEQVFESLFTWLGNVAPRVLETIGGIFEAIPAALEAAWPAVRDAFLGFVEETFGSDAADKVRDVFNQLHGVFDRLSEKLAAVKEAFDTYVAPAFAGLVEAVAPIVADALPKLVSIFETVSAAVMDVAAVVMEKVGQVVEFATPIIEGIYETVSSAFDGIKTTVEGVVGFVVSLVNGDFEGMKESVSKIFTGIKDTATSIWNSIKSAIEGPINKAKDIVKNAIDKIKGFFEFKFEWPHIPLPHFSISGSINPLDWLSGGLPSIGVEWYAKGGIVDAPTLIGAGERGGELIWPSYEPYMSRYAASIAEHMEGSGGTVNNYYIDGNLVQADAVLAAALDTVAQRVGGRRRMGVA